MLPYCYRGDKAFPKKRHQDCCDHQPMDRRGGKVSKDNQDTGVKDRSPKTVMRGTGLHTAQQNSG